MRKLKLQMQTTLDGYVAGPNGELDWMVFGTDEKLSARMNELVDSSDTLLLGRKMTKEFMDYWTKVSPESPEYSFAQKMVNIPKIVFSQTLKESNWINTVINNGDLKAEIERLKQQKGRDILVYGGAGFAASLVENNLIDEYNFFVNPAAIGKGLKIFDRLNETFTLKLIESESFDCGEVVLRYKPEKN